MSPRNRPLLDRYHLRQPLGAGGQGTVWRAEDALTGEVVAVKRVSADSGPWARRERAALRLLELPGVVRLLDEATLPSEEGGDALLVMELVEGSPLALGPGPQPWSAVAPRVVELLRLLRGVHGAGVVHRDLKPGHLLQRVGGGLVLIDFGVACGQGVTLGRLAGTGQVGSPDWAAPEQWADPEDADPRSDLYAVGLIALAMLRGEPCFPGDTPIQRAGRLSTLALPADLPPAARSVLGALLARRRRDRPASAEAALAALAAGSVAELEARLPVGWSWRRQELMGLFAGPERVLGRQRAAVSALRRAAGAGDPGAILAGWLAAGQARWVGDRVVVEPHTLAAARLGTLPVPLSVEAVLARADAAERQGDLLAAIRAVEVALGMVEGADPKGGPQVAALLRQRTRLALAVGGARALRLGLHALDRRADAGVEAATLLLQAALALTAGEAERAGRLLDAAPPDADERLDRWRVALRVDLARKGDIPDGPARAAMEAWWSRWGTASARADVAGWRALLAYRAGELDRAAALQRVAARGKPHGSGRLSALLNAAVALLEGGRFAAAAQAAVEAAALADALRHEVSAARAAWVLRTLDYRRGVAVRVDPALLEVAEALDAPIVAGQLFLAELAVALRVGGHPPGPLAAALAARWRRADRSLALFAEAAVRVTVPIVDEEPLREILAAAVKAPLPGLGLQTLGMVLAAAPHLRPLVSADLAALIARIPPAMRGGRREVFTIAEVEGGIYFGPEGRFGPLPASGGGAPARRS